MEYGRNGGVSARFRGAFPTDLVAVLLGLPGLVALVLVGSGWIRAIAGFPIVFFLPGYALTAALFPREDAGPDAIERIALAFGASLCLLPVVVLAFGAAGVALALVPLLAGLGVPTAVLAAVAAVRRWRVPRERRHQPRLRAVSAWAVRAAFPGDGRFDRVVGIVLVASVLLAVSSFGYALAMPADGEEFTDATLLAETEDGELASGGFPEEIDGSETVTVALENERDEETSYEVVVELQRVRIDGNEVIVEERDELTRLTETVPAGESATIPHEVEPTIAGQDLRVTYYVYRGGTGGDHDPDQADGTLYFWTDAGDAEQ